MHDRLVKVLSAAHTAVFRASGGVVGRRLVRNEMAVLTTKGRTSGRAHSVPLLVLRDLDDFVVIASYGGRSAHPDWYRNLEEQPEAVLQVGARRHHVTAETMTGHERAAWWPRIVEAYDGYAEYATRTTREIPVVRLRRHPRG